MRVMEGSRWFRRLVKECRKLSPHVRFKRIKFGFYRVYYKGAYIHEVYQEMPQKGYDMDDLDPRFENQRYFEEYEDEGEMTRKIKNYVEGYHDSLDRIRTRVYMMRNDKEFNQNAMLAYQQMIVK
jgi:hypothetical protein